MFTLGVITNKRKKRKRLEQMGTNELLEDLALVEKTSKKLDHALSRRDRERHDVCVLLRQQVATKAHLDAMADHWEIMRNSLRREAEVPSTMGHVGTGLGSTREEDVGSSIGLSLSGTLSDADRKHPSEIVKSINAVVARNLGHSTWALGEIQKPAMSTRVLCGLTQTNLVRKLCIRVASSRWFDTAILTVILISSVMMALDAPGLDSTTPLLKRIIVLSEELTLYIFTLECITKIIAFGLVCGPGTYLREHWNNLDVLVIIAGWMSLLFNQAGECKVHGLGFCSESTSSVTNIGPMRAVRVLRPLRTIEKLPGLKILVQTFLASLPELRDSLVLCIFILVLSGIVGVQLYMGTLRQQCMATADARAAGGGTLGGHLCALDGAGQFGRCAPGFVCQADAGINPNGGVTSFDNLPVAMLAVFQSITLEGWTDIMYDVRSVKGLINDIYFITLIVVGSLFMTNLVVAVLVSNFVEQTDQEMTKTFLDEEVPMTGSMTPSVRALIQQVDVTQYGWIRKKCFYISSSSRFNSFMMLLIVLNTLTMCLDNVISNDLLEVFNLVFTVVFTIEVLLKLLGFGWKLCFRDTFNKFDAVIVALSSIEIVLKMGWNMEGQSLMVLRTFRLLRVFKLARSMKSLRRICQAVFNSLRSIGYLGVLLLIFMFVCALMGMSSFGCTEDEVDIKPSERKWKFHESGYYKGRMVRPNFSTFLYSMTTVFIIITGENWNEIMYLSVERNGWMSAAYFIFVMITGNYVILKLFLAILIEKFDDVNVDEEGTLESSNAREEDDDRKSLTISSRTKSALCSRNSTGDEPEPKPVKKPRISSVRFACEDSQQPETREGDAVGDSGDAQSDPSCPTIEPHFAGPLRRSKSQSSASEASLGPMHAVVRRISSMKHREKEGSEESTSFEDPTPPRAKFKSRHSVSLKDVVAGEGFTGSSLYILGPESKLRGWLYRLVVHPYFDSMVYGLIAASAITLALDSPEQKDPDFKHVFYVMDCVLSSLFLVEALLKIVVYGFCIGERCYLRDGWNVLDLFVVITSIVNLIMGSGNDKSLSWMKALRAIRALRPLRMVSRSEGLKVVVNSIMLAAPAILDVLLVHVLFLVIFSILGVQLFKNTFYRCSCMEWCPERILDPSAAVAAAQPESRLCQGLCPSAPAHASACVWERHPIWSFDNVAFALLTLFEVSTLERWPEVMWLAVDGQSDSEGPEYNKNPIVVLFFISFLFVMSFFILNLFVGVVIDKFTEVRNEMLGHQLLSDVQLQWIQTQKKLLSVKPRPLVTPADDRWRQLALQLIATGEFEFIIMGLIIANVIVMCTTMYGASPGLRRIQDSANYVFIVCFASEAAIRIYALRPVLYFGNSSNLFDFVIVCGSIVSDVTADGGYVDATVLRVFRVARIFRLVKSLKSLRKLFKTLVMSLPSLGHIGIMLLLLFFVYAVAGMALFGDIQIEGNWELHSMSKDVNFSSFYIAMTLLFRASTGETWNGIMHDCFSGARCAEPPHEAACGNTVVAIVFFISFMIIGSFVFVNLFVAVIIEKLFENSQDGDDDHNHDHSLPGISEANLESFVEAWARLAPKAQHFIPTTKLPELLLNVDPPLGFKGQVMRKGVMIRLLARLGIHDHDGKVHFAEVLWRLASMVAGADMRNVTHIDVTRNLDKRILRAMPLPSRQALRDRAISGFMVVHLAADTLVAVRVQSLWRARKAQSMLQQIVKAYSTTIKEAKPAAAPGSFDKTALPAVPTMLTDLPTPCDISLSSTGATGLAGIAVSPAVNGGPPAVADAEGSYFIREAPTQDACSHGSAARGGVGVAADTSLIAVPEESTSPISDVLAMWSCTITPCNADCAPCEALTGRLASPREPPREFVSSRDDEAGDLLVMIDPSVVRSDEEPIVARERVAVEDCRIPSAAILVRDDEGSLLKWEL